MESIARFAKAKREIKTKDYKQIMCVGETLSLAYSSISVLVGESIPELDIRKDLSSKQTAIFIVNHFNQFKNEHIHAFDLKDYIPGHSVYILTFKHLEMLYIWYYNPWGHSKDKSHYPDNLALELISVQMKMNNVDEKTYKILEPESTMMEHGQEKSPELHGDKKLGKLGEMYDDYSFKSSYFWDEIYIYEMLDMVNDIKRDHKIKITPASLSKLIRTREVSLNMSTNSLEFLKLMGHKYLGHSNCVPLKMIMALYAYLPESSPHEKTNGENIMKIVTAVKTYDASKAEGVKDDFELVSDFMDGTGTYDASILLTLFPEEDAELEMHKERKKILGKCTKHIEQVRPQMFVEMILVLSHCKLSK